MLFGRLPDLHVYPPKGLLREDSLASGALWLPGWFERDGVAHDAELFDGAAFGFVWVAAGVEVRSGVGVEGAGGGHGPDRGEHGVFDGDDCLPRCTARGDAAGL